MIVLLLITLNGDEVRLVLAGLGADAAVAVTPVVCCWIKTDGGTGAVDLRANCDWGFC